MTQVPNVFFINRPFEMPELSIKCLGHWRVEARCEDSTARVLVGQHIAHLTTLVDSIANTRLNELVRCIVKDVEKPLRIQCPIDANRRIQLRLLRSMIGKVVVNVLPVWCNLLLQTTS